MKGFSNWFEDFPDYILGITKEIWEDRGIATLHHNYVPDLAVHSPSSMVIGNDNEWGARYADLLTWITGADMAGIPTEYDRGCQLELQGGVTGHGWDDADRSCMQLRAAFPDAELTIHHVTDAHTRGSDQKENFTIIGGGVSESPDQHVHIALAHGFNIGAAGQPPHCRNSLHNHRTAEVFFILSGRWRFFWGQHGDAGEANLEEGDIFNIPTNMFRGFENIGTDYGMIMAILRGNDAGGGVIWAPYVIQDAQAHGLVLGDKGKLTTASRGRRCPKAWPPCPC